MDASRGRTPVTVVGSGVSGLTTAIALQDEGHPVTVTSAEPPSYTTSSVAAAIWHPFFQAPDATYIRRAAATYQRLCGLAGEPGSGVRRRTLTEYFRTGVAAPWWMAAMADREPFEARDVPAGYASSYAMAVPVADTSRYLRFLVELFGSRGGQFRRSVVTDLRHETTTASWVVNCTGFGAAGLAGDPGMSLVRGVVLRCAKPPGLDGCWIDDSDPALPTYVVARESDVILGGTADPGLVSTLVPADAVTDIVRRCTTLVPALGEPQVLDVRVGFRPARVDVRLERDADVPGLVHNYGHGGSGFTLSWGCAADVVELIGRPAGA
ncbi:FAD-dependent oxidoreductase [Micromonospora sp. CPCC 205546]|uniref:FAD-dependent oxidoreductase n=1 Tax=Micromonospora sp. CPCC 205546 TaxID=3122397 RepID=UPI002FF2BCA4